MNRLVLCCYLATMVLLLKETVSASLALLDLYSLDQTLQHAWGMENGNQIPGRWLVINVGTIIIIKMILQTHNTIDKSTDYSCNCTPTL